jgi:ribonuclease E
MEAAEEIVRQLRLRDIGGIIVIDFIDMVLESNRDLVLRRLTECLGRDRTKHQVAEVTSLGLVQMTRKRVGQGLLEVFSEPCDHCRGRGVIVHTDPVDEKRRSGGGSSAAAGASVGGNGRRDRSGPKDVKDAGVKDVSVKDISAKDTAPTEEAADEPAAVFADGEQAEGSRSSRRNRGRRNRGQAGEDRAAEDAAVLAGTGSSPDGEVAPEDTPALSNAVEVVAVEDTSSQDAVVDEAGPAPVEIVPVDDDAEPVADVAARPRRRRAASRPAGPPV